MTDPDDGGRVPATMFSNVDLPQPLGPTMARNSPFLTLREVGPMACNVPKRAITLSNSI